MVSYDKLYQIEYTIGYEIGRQITLEVMSRRMAYPDETYEETAAAVGYSVETVEWVLSYKRGDKKMEKEKRFPIDLTDEMKDIIRITSRYSFTKGFYAGLNYLQKKIAEAEKLDMDKVYNENM